MPRPLKCPVRCPPSVPRKAIRIDPALGKSTRMRVSMLAARFLQLYEVAWAKGDRPLAKEVLHAATHLQGARVVNYDVSHAADREQPMFVLILHDEVSSGEPYEQILNEVK